MAELKQTQDPYMLFGLLTSQLIQVVALANASSVENVGKDLGASPYAVGNLKRAIKISPNKAKKALDIFYDADKANKSTGIDPWQATEIALKRLTQL